MRNQQFASQSVRPELSGSRWDEEGCRRLLKVHSLGPGSASSERERERMRKDVKGEVCGKSSRGLGGVDGGDGELSGKCC
jgi:hypothetical protein